MSSIRCGQVKDVPSVFVKPPFKKVGRCLLLFNRKIALQNCIEEPKFQMIKT